MDEPIVPPDGFQYVTVLESGRYSSQINVRTNEDAAEAKIALIRRYAGTDYKIERHTVGPDGQLTKVEDIT